jgi:hypothetical protein
VQREPRFADPRGQQHVAQYFPLRPSTARPRDGPSHSFRHNSPFAPQRERAPGAPGLRPHNFFHATSSAPLLPHHFFHATSSNAPSSLRLRHSWCARVELLPALVTLLAAIACGTNLPVASKAARELVRQLTRQATPRRPREIRPRQAPPAQARRALPFRRATEPHRRHSTREARPPVRRYGRDPRNRRRNCCRGGQAWVRTRDCGDPSGDFRLLFAGAAQPPATPARTEKFSTLFHSLAQLRNP